ncbi:atherin-like [Schistocerca nitens]|uniref:atherin-like n=1 Tax=Schistocerca nitens TaxID=7011 RepID=UPI002118C082|nr:atherin-like [Schistocerca nitens]
MKREPPTRAHPQPNTWRKCLPHLAGRAATRSRRAAAAAAGTTSNAPSRRQWQLTQRGRAQVAARALAPAPPAAQTPASAQTQTAAGRGGDRVTPCSGSVALACPAPCRLCAARPGPAPPICPRQINKTQVRPHRMYPACFFVFLRERELSREAACGLAAPATCCAATASPAGFLRLPAGCPGAEGGGRRAEGRGHNSFAHGEGEVARSREVDLPTEGPLSPFGSAQTMRRRWVRGALTRSIGAGVPDAVNRRRPLPASRTPEMSRRRLKAAAADPSLPCH